MIFLQCSHPLYLGDLAETARLFDASGRVVHAERIDALGPEDMAAKVTLRCEDGCAEGEASVAWYASGEPRTEFAVVGLELPEGELQRKKIEKRAIKLALYRALQKARPTPLAWGALTGIRPTKLLRELIASEGVKASKRTLAQEFGVSREKLQLIEEILRVQRGMLDVLDDVFDAYIGIPFCRTRCQYCAFTGYSAEGADVDGYLAALHREIADAARLMQERQMRLRCLYIGGGTPTAITPGQLALVLEAARALGQPEECTVEAGRPDTLSTEHLHMLREHGVTRISINPQSMNAETLLRIGRSHSPEDVEEAVERARAMGFDWINMDVIVGLPGETEEMIGRTLSSIAAISPENLTVHSLAIKRASALAGEDMKKALPETQTAQRMLAMCHDAAAGMGMEPYYLYRQKYMAGNLENVGYAKPGMACRYNIDHMEETTSILAMGAGAISKWIFDGGRRIERAPNPKDLATYMAKVDALGEAKRAMIGPVR